MFVFHIVDGHYSDQSVLGRSSSASKEMRTVDYGIKQQGLTGYLNLSKRAMCKNPETSYSRERYEGQRHAVANDLISAHYIE